MAGIRAPVAKKRKKSNTGGTGGSQGSASAAAAASGGASRETRVGNAGGAAAASGGASGFEAEIEGDRVLNQQMAEGEVRETQGTIAASFAAYARGGASTS